MDELQGEIGLEVVEHGRFRGEDCRVQDEEELIDEARGPLAISSARGPHDTTMSLPGHCLSAASWDPMSPLITWRRLLGSSLRAWEKTTLVSPVVMDK
jgi:hypothetical protein